MKETRLYSLFEKQDGKWVRLTSLSFKKSTAVKFFQGLLLDGILYLGKKRELRPVKE